MDTNKSSAHGAYSASHQQPSAATASSTTINNKNAMQAPASSGNVPSSSQALPNGEQRSSRQRAFSAESTSTAETHDDGQSHQQQQQQHSPSLSTMSPGSNQHQLPSANSSPTAPEVGAVPNSRMEYSPGGMQTQQQPQQTTGRPPKPQTHQQKPPQAPRPASSSSPESPQKSHYPPQQQTQPNQSAATSSPESSSTQQVTSSASAGVGTTAPIVRIPSTGNTTHVVKVKKGRFNVLQEVPVSSSNPVSGETPASVATSTNAQDAPPAIPTMTANSSQPATATIEQPERRTSGGEKMGTIAGVEAATTLVTAASVSPSTGGTTPPTAAATNQNGVPSPSTASATPNPPSESANMVSSTRPGTDVAASPTPPRTSSPQPNSNTASAAAGVDASTAVADASAPMVRKKGRFVITSVAESNPQKPQMVPITLAAAPTVIATIPAAPTTTAQTPTNQQTPNLAAAAADAGDQTSIKQQQQQQPGTLVYAAPAQTVMMAGVVPTQQVVYAAATAAPRPTSSVAEDTDESVSAAPLTGAAITEPSKEGRETDQDSSQPSSGQQSAANKSRVPAKSNESSDSAKPKVRQQQTQRVRPNLASLNGLHKVFYFLDQMKTEVTDADRTIKALQAEIKSMQNDMKFMKEKNKELESKARDAERKCSEERTLRESAEGKLFALKKRMRELKEEGLLPIMNGDGTIARKLSRSDSVDKFVLQQFSAVNAIAAESSSKTAASEDSATSNQTTEKSEASPQGPQGQGQQAPPIAKTESPVKSSKPVKKDNEEGTKSEGPSGSDAGNGEQTMASSSGKPPMLTPPRETPSALSESKESVPAMNRGANRTSGLEPTSSNQQSATTTTSSSAYGGRGGENFRQQATSIPRQQSTSSTQKSTAIDFDPLRPQQQQHSSNGNLSNTATVSAESSHSGGSPPTGSMGAGGPQEMVTQAPWPVLMMDQQAMAYPIPFVQVPAQQAVLSGNAVGQVQQQPARQATDYRDFAPHGMLFVQQPDPQMMAFQQQIFQLPQHTLQPGQTWHGHPSEMLAESPQQAASQQMTRQSKSVTDFDPLQQVPPSNGNHSANTNAGGSSDPFGDLMTRPKGAI